jgi:hypothetical protein
MFSDIRQFVTLSYQAAPHYGPNWEGDAPTVNHVNDGYKMAPGGGENGPAPTVDHVASHA